MTITPDNILHWKRKLEKNIEEREILITLSKLKKAPMTIKLLQETGIGKTVKALKKNSSGQVATKSEDLVNQWKKLLDNQSPSKNSESRKDSKHSHVKHPKEANGHAHQNDVKPAKSSHHGSNASSKKKDEKLIKFAENTTEGLNSSAGSFEACLGLNDSFQAKKKKPTQNSVKTSPSKSTPSSHTSSKPPSHKSSESSSKQKHIENGKKSSQQKKIKAEPSLPPELQKPDLAPLEPVDVLSTLPEIQPHYKPLPHIEPPPSSNKRKVLTNDEAVYFTTTKRDRTAVYSGRKLGGVGDVPSLVQYCTKYLLDNIEDLSETGGVPFNLLKPILEKCSVNQLYTLEDYNPYLLEDTDYLWEIHCKRDFKNCQRGEFETWREIYLKLYDERQEKFKAVTANISASKASAAPVRTAKIAYVDVAAKPPRDVARKQAKLGTASSANNPPRAPRPPQSAPSTSSSQHSSEPSSSSAPSTSSSSSSSTTTPLQVKKPKVAPLMQKTLRLMKNMRR